MREITDGLKHDLGLVICDNPFCLQRGDWTNCYLSPQYRDCVHYQANRERVREKINKEKHKKLFG